MKKYGLYALLLGVILGADQLTKKAALADLLNAPPVEVTPFFNLVFVWNRGVSFGLLRDLPPIVLSIVLMLVALALTVWFFRTSHKPLRLALCTVVAGAIGNIIDRLRFGAVVDFLDFHAFGFHWPAFNIADAAIVLGIAFVLLDGLFFEPKRKNLETTEA